MRLDLPLQGPDLGVEDLRDRDRRADRGRVGGVDDLGLAQVLATERLLDRGGLGGDVVAADLLQRRADLGERELGRGGRVGALASNSRASVPVSVNTWSPATRPGNSPAAPPAAAACGGCVPRSTSDGPGHDVDRLDLHQQRIDVDDRAGLAQRAGLPCLDLFQHRVGDREDRVRGQFGAVDALQVVADI